MRMCDKKVEACFLGRLFEEFRTDGVSYCVLRNYEPLPESLGGSDLDLAVLPTQRKLAAEVVLGVAREFGGKAIVDYTSSGRFIRLLGCHAGVWWGAAIDLFWKMEYRGVEYISSGSVINRAVDHRGIRVALDEDAALIALIKELLSNGKSRKDYFPSLCSLYAEKGRGVLALMDHGFSDDAKEKLTDLLELRKEPQDRVANLVKILRKDVLSKALGRHACGALVNIWWRFKRILKPAGVSIALTGTDGSGKSTVINAITPVLTQALHSKVYYEHLRPNWLPALGVAAGKRAKGDGSPVTDPHSKKPSGFIGSLVRLAYYWLDYSVGYMRVVYPRLVRRAHITLFDRYYYDVIMDPRRMRISLPRWVMKMAFSLVPKPKLVICLGAAPEVLYARKPETSLEEVTRQVGELEAFARRTKNAVWVDTGQSLNGSVNEVLKAIQTTMASRYV